MPDLRPFLLTLLVILAGTAAAHRVNLFAWPEGGEIVIESGFSGGSKARGAVITVTAPEGGPAVVTGKTDESGTWRFTPPAELVKAGKGALLTVDAGEEHRNT
ncbi:hypothetical protein [Sutterella sp.]|uniref:hypothetical protein n=1 Tax=Sutterella sp. TaxID=1981025 RepID=UPI0026DF741D|nr:hypothetical protein [Sutterella sp.]MDO5530520.1 hypothetical protein [Sutterella sp.]